MSQRLEENHAAPRKIARRERESRYKRLKTLGELEPFKREFGIWNAFQSS
jgi:hypothetical protein